MASRLATRHGGPVGLAALVAILLLGVGLRVGDAWDGRAPVYDAQAYAAIAANLERGEGFTVGAGATQPSSNYSPGLPLLVAGIYELGGGVDERAARVVLALLGSLAVLFTYLIGRRLGGGRQATGPADQPPPLGVVADRPGGEESDQRSMDLGRSGAHNASSVVSGLLGALAVAVYPAFLEYGGMLMSEPLAATLLSGAVLAMFWAWDEVRDPSGGRAWPRWLLAGLLLGALTLVRPEYLGIAVLLAVIVFVSGWLSRPTPAALVAQRATSANRDGEWRHWLGMAAVLLAGLAVVVVPWTVRNAVALDRFVPVSTGGGQVLYAGTYLPSDGDPEKVGAGVVAENPQLFAPGATATLRLEQILARLAAHTYPELETDQALARMGREQLWDDLSEEPLEYAGFVATKIERIWSHGPRDVMREPLWAALHWALLVFGMLGLAVLGWQRRWEALVIGTVFLSITAISALLVASPRRVLVMLPLLAALAGAGAVWLWAQSRNVARRSSQNRSPKTPAST